MSTSVRKLTCLQLVLDPADTEAVAAAIPIPLAQPPRDLHIPQHKPSKVLLWESEDGFEVDFAALPCATALGSFIEDDPELLLGFYCVCKNGDTISIAPTWGLGIRPVVRVDTDLCATDEDVQRAMAYNGTYLSFLYRNQDPSAPPAPPKDDADQLMLFSPEADQNGEKPLNGE